MADTKVRISKRTVDALEAQEKRYRAMDTDLSGFGVRVTPAGVKTYFVRYRPAGAGRSAVTKDYTIGKHGVVTPDQARAIAKDVLAAVHDGQDPQSTRAVKPQEAGANVTEARTAAAIYGQTAWATFTATTNRVSRLQDDGYVESGTIYRAGVGSLTSYWPQEGGANVTEARTAAAVYGQGALATLNSLDLTSGRLTGFGYFAAFNQITLNSAYLKRADGSTEVTESLVVTQIGVAAAISNQGSLAVQSYVNPGQFRESDTYTLPLRTTAWQSGRIDFIDNSYSGFYTDAAGEIGFVQQVTYWHNEGSVALDQKVRSGDVPFVIIGNGVVDEYLSAWYEIIRNSDGAILTGTTWISDARESGSGTGGVGFGRVMVINIPVGSRINFYLSVKKSDRSPNSGDRSIRTATLTVAAINA